MQYGRFPHEVEHGINTTNPTTTRVDLIETDTTSFDFRSYSQSGASSISESEVLNRSFEPRLDISTNAVLVRGSRMFPIFTTALVLVTLVVLWIADVRSCSQPLVGWSLVYVSRHVAKATLYRMAASRSNTEGTIPEKLVWGITLVDLAGPVIWTLGGYYIFHTESCSTVLYSYAVILWTLQSISLLLPCCFVSIILFCAPCLLWLAPYIIRPNPNTVATSRETLSKIPRMPYSVLCDNADNASCAICLADYQAEDEVMKLACDHFFHSQCISQWACLSQLCPICRTNITTEASTRSQEAV